MLSQRAVTNDDNKNNKLQCQLLVAIASYYVAVLVTTTVFHVIALTGHRPDWAGKLSFASQSTGPQNRFQRATKG